MNAPNFEASSTFSLSPDASEPYCLVPVLHLKPEKVQEYWLNLVMHDTIKYRLSDVDDPSWDTVVDMIRRMGRQMYMVTRLNGDRPIAEFMLENFTGQSAQLHFSFLPEVTIKEKLEIGKYVLKYIFEKWTNPDTGEPFLRSVFGLTPCPNRVACIFALKAGFKKLGILPSGCKYRGRVVDAMISVASNG